MIVFLFIIVAMLSFLEVKLYKTYLTPFNVFAIPFVFIVIMQWFWINVFDGFRMSFEYIASLIVFFVNFYLVGIITYYSLIRFSHVNISTNNSSIKKQYLSIIEVLFIFSAVFLILVFCKSALSLSNIAEIVQKDFQENYSGGINFYFRILSIVGAVYFITIGGTKKNYALALLCFVPNFVTFVKGISLIVLLAGFIGHIKYHNKRIRMFTVIKITFIGLLLFFLVYLIEALIWDFDKFFEIDTYKYILLKIMNYFISGPQSFNINISQENLNDFSDQSDMILAPILNILYKLGIYDQRIDTVSSIRTIIYYDPLIGIVEPNINTYIGTLLLHQGLIKSLGINSVISFVIYLYFYLYKRTNNISCLIMFSLLSAGLSFGWFEYYFMHTFWMYLIIYTFFLSNLEKN